MCQEQEAGPPGPKSKAAPCLGGGGGWAGRGCSGHQAKGSQKGHGGLDVTSIHLHWGWTEELAWWELVCGGLGESSRLHETGEEGLWLCWGRVKGPSLRRSLPVFI